MVREDYWITMHVMTWYHHHLHVVWYRCGHCKSLVPEMKTLGGAYLQEPSLADQVVIAKVGCTTTQLRERERVSVRR
jgi:hypothetical protein